MKTKTRTDPFIDVKKAISGIRRVGDGFQKIGGSAPQTSMGLTDAFKKIQQSMSKKHDHGICAYTGGVITKFETAEFDDGSTEQLQEIELINREGLPETIYCLYQSFNSTLHRSFYILRTDNPDYLIYYLIYGSRKEVEKYASKYSYAQGQITKVQVNSIKKPGTTGIQLSGELYLDFKTAFLTGELSTLALPTGPKKVIASVCEQGESIFFPVALLPYYADLMQSNLGKEALQRRLDKSKQSKQSPAAQPVARVVTFEELLRELPD